MKYNNFSDWLEQTWDAEYDEYLFEMMKRAFEAGRDASESDELEDESLFLLKYLTSKEKL